MTRGRIDWNMHGSTPTNDSDLIVMTSAGTMYPATYANGNYWRNGKEIEDVVCWKHDPHLCGLLTQTYAEFDARDNGKRNND